MFVAVGETYESVSVDLFDLCVELLSASCNPERKRDDAHGTGRVLFGIYLFFGIKVS